MGDIEDPPDLTTAERARLHLIASVLLTFAAHVVRGHAIRPACSLGAVHPYCLDAPTAPQCVYCALSQARIWYTLMTGTPAAEMAEALTLAQDDAEARELHLLGDASSTYGKAVARTAPHLLTELARLRLRAATAGTVG